jgi:hypothetical protein
LLKDFTTDNNPTAVYHADSKLGIPEYVKSAELITPEVTKDLASVAFAEPRQRLFPVFSKAATYLSAAYLYGNKIENPVVESNIKRAAELFGISEDVKQLDDLFASLTKQASEPGVKYALTTDFEGEFGLGVQNFYPIGNYGEIVGSSELMLKDAHEDALPIEFLRSASIKLVKAAGEHGVDLTTLHPKLTSLGTLRMPDFETAANAIGYRKQAGLNEDQLDEYRDILAGAEAEFSKFASHTSEDTIMEMDKWAELWCLLDRENGIKYASVPNPYASFFTGMTMDEFEKAAASNVFVGGVMVPDFEVGSLKDEMLDANFSADDAKIIKSARELAKTSGTTSCSLASDALSKLDEATSKDLLRVMLNAY